MLFKIWEIGRKASVLSLLMLSIIFGTTIGVNGYLTGTFELWEMSVIVLVVLVMIGVLYTVFKKTDREIKTMQAESNFTTGVILFSGFVIVAVAYFVFGIF